MNLKSNRFILLFCLTTLLGVALPGEVAAGEWQLIKPLDSKAVNLKIKEKDRLYWRLDKDKSVVLKTEGPGKLKVISRAVIPEKKKEQVYDFVTYGDDERQRIARATTVSKIAKNPRKSIFSLPIRAMSRKREKSVTNPMASINTPDKEEYAPRNLFQ